MYEACLEDPLSYACLLSFQLSDDPKAIYDIENYVPEPLLESTTPAPRTSTPPPIVEEVEDDVEDDQEETETITDQDQD